MTNLDTVVYAFVEGVQEGFPFPFTLNVIWEETKAEVEEGAKGAWCFTFVYGEDEKEGNQVWGAVGVSDVVVDELEEFYLPFLFNVGLQIGTTAEEMLFSEV